MLFSTNAADDTDRVRIKICGLTREDDVVSAIQAGADAVGFVCYPASTRYVTPSRLMSLISLVPDSVDVVLLFINPTVEEVREHLAFFPRAVLQFQGAEARAFCDQFHHAYIKAVKADTTEDLLRAERDYPMAQAIVAETDPAVWRAAVPHFDWGEDGALRHRLRKPLIIAGGLSDVNVFGAIRQMRPWAVDVASGVETARGIKDPGKILSFVDAVQRGGVASA